MSSLDSNVDWGINHTHVNWDVNTGADWEFDKNVDWGMNKNFNYENVDWEFKKNPNIHWDFEKNANPDWDFEKNANPDWDFKINVNCDIKNGSGDWKKNANSDWGVSRNVNWDMHGDEIWKEKGFMGEDLVFYQGCLNVDDSCYYSLGLEEMTESKEEEFFSKYLDTTGIFLAVTDWMDSLEIDPGFQETRMSLLDVTSSKEKECYHQSKSMFEEIQSSFAWSSSHHQSMGLQSSQDSDTLVKDIWHQWLPGVWNGSFSIWNDSSVWRQSSANDSHGNYQNKLTGDFFQNKLSGNYQNELGGGYQSKLSDLETAAERSCQREEVLQGEPHEAIFYALQYLGLKDLLSVEMVCKSLCTAVRSDVLLWKRIHVEEYPLNERIRDETLWKLVRRSQGLLQELSLVGCLYITNDGLRSVLEVSPKLIKLCLPLCTRLTADGIVKNIKLHKGKANPGLKQLRIGSMYRFSGEQFEDLQSLLNSGQQEKSSTRKPQYYPVGGRYSGQSDDDDKTIDIESCPRCGTAGLVYDCTMETCRKQKNQSTGECRGCTACISRCDGCGRCINGNEYAETFSLDLLCLKCWLASPLYEDEFRIHILHMCG